MKQRRVESVHEIREILTDRIWRVRPEGQEVPVGLRGSLAANVLSSFARMTDDDRHQDRKQLVIEELDALDLGAIPETTREIVRSLDRISPVDVQYIVPGMVIGQLLGVRSADQRALVEQVRALVIGARAHATHAESTTAIVAIERAVPIVAATLDPVRRDNLDNIAARISMLFQASDAGAALIGNALLALSSASDGARHDGTTLVRESMRARVPVRSTMRFRDDERAVLDLDAAHHRHPDAEWTFGFGPHACPGRTLAIHLAVACIDAVLEVRPFDPSMLASSGWEDLPNVWIPKLVLEHGEAK